MSFFFYFYVVIFSQWILPTPYQLTSFFVNFNIFIFFYKFNCFLIFIFVIVLIQRVSWLEE